jgi:thiol-disulfide isomerase/thioredoxin
MKSHTIRAGEMPMFQLRWIALASVLALASILVGVGCTPSPAAVRLDPNANLQDEKRIDAPELDGGVAWLNTAGPLSIKKDLKGKIVLLDFWTLCCINCIHIMPDLAKLEKKYPNELVVIGVHSPKFDNEKDTKSIRKAILRYEIAHPVVNDAERKIWDKYEINSWPSMAMIDPEGKFVGQISGEGNYEILDKTIAKLIEIHKKKGTLNEKPLRFDLIRYREKNDSPLFFPGKLLADEKSNRLFISDSTHHRVVITDLVGKKQAIIGNGTPGFKDGNFADVQFDDPQGLALDGDTLYIADRKNHSIRAADLKAGKVTTIAGTGTQDGSFQNRQLSGMVGVKTIGLNSPWDLMLVGKQLFIAMAGHHQIWLLDLAKGEMGPYAGDGAENIKDGPLYASRFSQPSGLTNDGKFFYVADSEISAIRKVPFGGTGRVETLVGTGLFNFGDKDGIGTRALLQHALAVQYNDGLLYIADTYNSKIKTLDLKTLEVKTFLGGDSKNPLFDEPAGLSLAGGKLYVADTNASRIRVVDLSSKAVTTLELKGVEPPPAQKEWLPPDSKK